MISENQQTAYVAQQQPHDEQKTFSSVERMRSGKEKSKDYKKIIKDFFSFILLKFYAVFFGISSDGGKQVEC